MTARKAEQRAGYMFAMPWFIGFSVFLAYPILASIYFSFTEYSVLKPPLWVGLDNYSALIRDDVFWKSLYNTLFFAALFIPIGTFVAIGLALLLNTKVRGMAFYRTVFFLPSLVPVVSLAILWLWLFNGEYGLINAILGWFGINGPNWLGSP
ncbi:MAG TPA: sugar ABC transporter permease, partial [Fimbriimonadaceae bacterium]|nr:sugar ABC transporter permease [Fimbriimonadaceae bacterium]